MRYVITFLVFLVNFILQTTLFRGLEIFGVIPNTTLVLVALYSLLFKEKHGIVFGILFGLAHDILYGQIIGLTALLFFIVGFWLMNSKSIYKDTVFSSLILVVGATVFFNIGYWIFMVIFGIEKSFVYIIPKIVIEIIYNLGITYVVYKIFVRAYSELKK